MPRFRTFAGWHTSCTISGTVFPVIVIWERGAEEKDWVGYDWRKDIEIWPDDRRRTTALKFSSCSRVFLIIARTPSYDMITRIATFGKLL